RPGSKQLGHRKSTAQTQEYRTGLKRATSSLLSGTEWKRLSRVWNDWEAFQVEGVPAGLSPRLLGNTQLALAARAGQWSFGMAAGQFDRVPADGAGAVMGVG